MGRTIAIGDIHGCFTALKMLIGEIQPSSEDHFIFLGDYVDRGPDSAKVISFLMEFRDQFASTFLKGNHEVMMIQSQKSQGTRRSWLQCGGRETLDSYDRQFEVGGLVSVPADHWDFFESCRLTFEDKFAVYVHGCYDGNDSLEDQLEATVCWRNVDQIVPPKSGKPVICGHTSQKTGVPLQTEDAICIDTWAYGKGWLTALDVEKSCYWQANQMLDVREGKL